MKTNILIVIVSFLLSIASPVFAFDVSDQQLTPLQRVQQNAEKVELDPSLRGRWNPEANEPASQRYYPSEDLPQKILMSLREEESLKNSPILLKIRSTNRVVTLEGVVNNETERRLIEQKAKEAGATSVKNQLRIKTSDEELIDLTKGQS